MKSIIEIEDLTVSIGNLRVLSNVFISINPGKIIGVIGPNGAGKSTLFKSILGLMPIAGGEIKVFGMDPKKAYSKIAYLPQKDETDTQFPVIVEEVVSIGRMAHKPFYKGLNASDRMIIEETMHQLDIWKIRKRHISELSGGQQQRVFLARALAQKPSILFLDEPFVGVDIRTEHSIIKILKELATQNVTVLLVHHDLSTVVEYLDEVILINQRLIAHGAVNKVFTDENIATTFGGQLKVLHKIRG